MRNVNVLLVEDNEINQLVACSFLKKWGMGVTVANDGKEALSIIESKNFQLVLMDLQMPEMDGYESTHKIRSMDDNYFKTIPILAFSSSSLIQSVEKAIQCGMTDFVTKPLVPDDLQSKINKYVMNTTIQQAMGGRPLSIDFDMYTDGDAAFKREIVLLMINNIVELQQALNVVNEQGNTTLFAKTCHKVASTLTMLEDVEFMDTINKIKDPDISLEEKQHSIKSLHIMCDGIAISLEKESK